jgi:hypothetical protein
MPGKVKRRTVVLFVLFSSLLIGILASKPPEGGNPVYKNLKVLAKDMNEEKMEMIMHSFNSELGVTCIYCHITDNRTIIPKADFVSDEKPEKRIARDMLKMTLKLNRKYFGSRVDAKIEAPFKIWCTTCHHGLPKP